MTIPMTEEPSDPTSERRGLAEDEAVRALLERSLLARDALASDAPDLLPRHAAAHPQALAGKVLRRRLEHAPTRARATSSSA